MKEEYQKKFDEKAARNWFEKTKDYPYSTGAYYTSFFDDPEKDGASPLIP